MPWISGAHTAPAADLEAITVENITESVSPYSVSFSKGTAVHRPHLHSAYAGIFSLDFPDELHRELFQGNPSQINVCIMLVISLLALTKQPAQFGDCISLRTLCVQASYCLVPAFFLTGMLNISSATSIIVSRASARIFSWRNSFFKRVISARRAS